jgi:LysM repeat protein
LVNREAWLRERAVNAPTGPQPVTIYARRGETIDTLARWAGVPAAKLAASNELSGSGELAVGTPVHFTMSAEQLDAFESARKQHHDAVRDEFAQKFTVVDTKKLAVKKGDSPWKLRHSGKHPVPEWMLEDYNPGVDWAKLQIGTTVVIPQLVPRSEAPEAAQALAEPQAAEDALVQAPDLLIRVQAGETLEHYAAWSGQSVRAIAQRNGLQPEASLTVGQELKLPIPDSNIAQFYRNRSERRPASAQASAPPSRAPLPAAVGRADVAAPAAPAAQAKRDTRAPKSEPALANKAGTATYTVQPGDSGWKIAVKKLGVTLPELEALNPGVDLGRLDVGDVIRVPAKR